MIGKRGLWALGGIALAGVAGYLVSAALTGGGDVPRPPADLDIAAGAALYEAQCATCHGADLSGQPNWQAGGPDGTPLAPPHDASGHTWHHGDGLLFTYVKLGGAETLARQGIAFDSGMPGFGEVMSDREIWEILAFIKSTWPERIRAVQAERTAAEG